MSIYEPNQSFDFSKVSLTTPTIASGGNYFIKFRMTDDEPLYVQPPKCTTKQGIVKPNGGKRMHCDLVFSNINESFIKWVEDLEKHAQESIFHNRDKWFESQLELEDIENSFAPSLKIYKSGKMYLLRTTVPTRLGSCGLKIFNEDQTEFDINHFEETTNVITILEIQGVKCSSKSFQLEIEIKQMMVLKPNILFDKCVIRAGTSDSSTVVEGKNTVVSSALNTNSLGNIAPPSFTNNNHTANLPKETTERGKLNVKEESGISKVEDARTVVVTENTPIEKPGGVVEGHGKGEGTNEEDDEEEEQSDEEDNDEEDDELLEVDFDLKSIDADDEPLNLKERDEIYKNIYKEAVEKAKEARNLAIYSYLEAKRIKNLYLIQET
jgi:hypothetical protein